MDDFYFPHCQWAAEYHERARIEEAVLIYSGLKTPTVLAFGLSERFETLLDELIDLLPEKFFCHYQKDHHQMFLTQYNEKPLGDFIKKELKDDSKISSVSESDLSGIELLNNSHIDMLNDFYKASYPESYFEKHMLKSNLYFGMFENGKLLSVAGVHVDSKEFSVTALGNIATHPKHRGRGLAKAVTARLLKEVISKRDVITLNVKTDNPAAIKCYENLGFVKSHEYNEGLFTRK